MSNGNSDLIIPSHINNVNSNFVPASPIYMSDELVIDCTLYFSFVGYTYTFQEFTPRAYLDNFLMQMRKRVTTDDMSPNPYTNNPNLCFNELNHFLAP